ncbi:hypothetical protein CHL76_02365 [Marinococcus halophilus]|uniref:CTP synthase n=1 Tax=Marinococcus halophilus TaxID=1371 RepID=A0A510Y1H8_MARHA|nr:DUF6241 domain-containing protein [Marinococcus halophilus]OZT81219.1 hypothetical protein CHL76_02365 [Marinococcus halophilus]GEK57156.1 CTP synthase [Marinococcus halophilus]
MKKLIAVIVVGIILAGGIFTYNVLSSLEQKVAKQDNVETASAENEKTKRLNEASHENENGVTTEARFQEKLHNMTHQKVDSNDKWGERRITEERIDNMLQTLDEQTTYQNEKFYQEALTAWDNGNFENSVEVHNKIWSMQEGTVGRATGLLTEEEEQEYIEENFSEEG